MQGSESDSIVYFDEIKAETKKSTLFLISGKEYWFPNEHIEINKEEKIVELPKWLFDKHFI